MADMADRIRKLLATAEDPRLTEEARAAYLEKAQELMIKHAIDEAMIDASGTREIGEITTRVWFKGERSTGLIKAKRELLIGLARLHRSDTIMHGANGRDYMTVIGFASDLDHVEL